MKGSHVLLLFFGLFCFGVAEERLSLDSPYSVGSWKVLNQDGRIRVNGSVPGGIYSDLLKGGWINESLFHQNNDQELRWVPRENWTYSRSFDIPPQIFNKTLVNLVFHGVDTVADIILNGQVLGSVDNMFVRYVYNITQVKKRSNNTLEIRFKSPIYESARRASEYPYSVPPECVPDVYRGECHVQMIRKMQASFSWDWGPAFPSVGLWKSVEIEGFNTAVLRDLTAGVSTFVDAGDLYYMLTMSAYGELATPKFNGTLAMSFVDLSIGRERTSTSWASQYDNDNYIFLARGQLILNASEVSVWWPNGFGLQPLYELNLTMVSFDSDEPSTKSQRLGMKTVELVQDKEGLQQGKDGLNFYIKVNGVPIFAKGANWIPGHILPELGTQPSAFRNSLLSAADAHMNMLRIWGGGVYESDGFYDLADELGILIWQDMMFASAMYPTNSNFLNSAKTEVEQQIRRLTSHASLAIWAGNNENEGVLRSGYFGTNDNYDLYYADYLKLYVDIVKKTVEENDRSHPYVSSSPSNGIVTEQQGFVADDPGSQLFGDIHYYNYGSDGWNSKTFQIPRFASEYGYQSMASLISLQEVSEEKDWFLGSEFNNMRQHHPDGNSQMAGMIKHQLPLGDDDSSKDYFLKFIYYSQISQAMSIKTETETYRKWRTNLTDDNRGHTMGALYWQLNDVWQAPTWSSIELSGRWKMLHYFAKKFFSPLLVVLDTQDNNLQVNVVSDLLTDVDLEFTLRSYKYDSFTPNAEIIMNVTAVAASSQLISVANFNQDCSPETCFLYAQLTLPSLGLIVSDNYHFLSTLIDAQLASSGVTVTIDEVSAYYMVLTVKVENIGLFVWLETEAFGYFSDNGFIAIQEETKIDFNARGVGIDVERFMITLKVHAFN